MNKANQPPNLHITYSLGTYQERIEAALDKLTHDRILERIWAHDHTVWKPEPDEITNRLGWLRIAEVMMEDHPRLKALVSDVKRDGYTQALLLGMGGSSLAPQVFHKTLGVKEDHLDLAVLDSTDPGAVLHLAESLDPTKTLYIVATKSGGTVETLSFFKYFYNHVSQVVGEDRAGEHFIAITDPGSKLADLARSHNFRSIFLNDPDIGGRYSALSHFGLVPAALLGVDLARLLSRALDMACGSEPCVSSEDNPGARLGAVLGELVKAGRDKVTFVISPSVTSFGDWVEQLIAESTGKEGRGILPVVGEPLGPPKVYGDDRLFVHIQVDSDESDDKALAALEAAGHPVVRLGLRDIYDLGGQFFLWELATAVAGHIIGINPFDQPNVESAKVLARQMVAEYQEKGSLPKSKAVAPTPKALREFIGQAQPGAYLALQVYLQPSVETDKALFALRTALRDNSRLATTVGYGPRFLHSTGQLHKGDAGKGLFIQFTGDDAHDVPIPDQPGLPDSSISFGVLKMAQVLGDSQALREVGRRVIRFHLGADPVTKLNQFTNSLA
jgi:glucose-6-phosphate isomerase